jgi:hypothetical protein
MRVPYASYMLPTRKSAFAERLLVRNLPLTPPLPLPPLLRAAPAPPASRLRRAGIAL